MLVYGTHLWGMHLFWWIFWLMALIAFLLLLTPVPRQQMKRLQETPRETLLRRLARGEINEAEYERRKAIIDRDARQAADEKKVAIVGGTGKPLAT